MYTLERRFSHLVIAVILLPKLGKLVDIHESAGEVRALIINLQTTLSGDATLHCS